MKARKALLFLGTAAITACGGGGNQVAGIDGGGAPAPVVIDITSQGTITGFGSVIVNGVRYDTSSASFTIDGQPGTESDLTVGQVIVVKGTLNQDGTTGTADSVAFDDAVEGPIESIDVPNNSMVVLGQTVFVNGDTSYEDDINPADLTGLSVGDVVEVSGYLDANGDIVATYVELEDMSSGFEVTGIAQNVDTTAMTLTIGALVVDYSGAMVEDFPNGMPENDQLVEAEGTTLGAGGELIATELEFKGNDVEFDDGDDVEIEGLITRFASATDFDVNGIPVTTTGSTQYEGGTSADLALNVKVEVEGEANASGVIVADKVEFEQEGELEIAGLVEDVQSDRLTVLGIEILVNIQTEFKDETSQQIQNFDIGDVNVGDYVETRAYDDMGSITATRLERDEDPGEVELRGIAENVADPNFTILGVTVQTNANTDFEENDLPILRDDFFNRAPGSLVEAKGQLQGGIIIADEVELED